MLLQTIGFDLDNHLAAVKDSFNDVDFSHIGFLSEKKIEDEDSALTSVLSSLLLNDNRKSQLKYAQDPIFYRDGANDISEVEEEVRDVKTDVHAMLKRAEGNGVHHGELGKWKRLVFEFEDVFRNKMTSDSPAKIAPMTIILQEGVLLVRTKVRKYSAPQLDFIQRKVIELEKNGMVYKSKNSRWASAFLGIPKPGREQFRLTVDLRAADTRTEQHL